MASEGSPGMGRWAGWAALWFGVGFGLYLFLHSPFFAVHQVEVRGASLLSPQEVIALSGITPGESLLRIDGERIRRRLEEDPRIGAARVRRIPPDRLVLEVDERVPVALLPYADGFLFVDEAGRLIAADRRSRPGLPVVTGVPLDRVGLHLPPPEHLVVAADVAALMPPGLRAVAAEINASNPDDLLLLTADGLPIFLGEPVELERKLAVAESLLPRPGEPVAAIDVRVPSVPTVRGL